MKKKVKKLEKKVKKLELRYVIDSFNSLMDEMDNFKEAENEF